MTLHRTETAVYLCEFCRTLHGLALAGDLQLPPAHAAVGVYVLHARDATVPPLQGQEARGRGGAAFPQRTGRPHRMGAQPD